MLIDDFNNTIDTWINELQHYSFEKLIIRPGEESWSLGQVYMHIINETKWYIGQIEICLSNNENASGQMKEGGKIIFANNSFPDLKIKGDVLTAANMPQPTNKEELQKELQSLKLRMSVLWNEIVTSKFIGKTTHPGNGYFNAREWFQHAEMHLRHHLRQKKRIDDFFMI
ncbi:MAG: DinB family protein [Bacteroidetes bacterium]|nr:DinB family protein [Bacteroidota bacterium]